MKDIDFLPESFREAAAERHNNVWRTVVVAVVGLVISSSGGLQLRSRRQMREHVELARSNFRAVAALSAELPELEANLRSNEAESELITYLRHPWPRTRVLEAIVRSLPDEVTLTDVRIGRENVATPAGPPVEKTAKEGDKNKPTLHSATEDMQTLRERFDGRRAVIYITGVARNPVALHNYLIDLGRNELLVDPQLEYVQSGSVDADGPGAKSDAKHAADRRFGARVMLRPGFGQPSGPTDVVPLETVVPPMSEVAAAEVSP